MPKIKTNRAAAKRFKATTKRKRNLRQATITDATNVKNMKKVLPYL